MGRIIRTIKGNSFEIYRKEMERCKDTGSLKPEYIDKKQVAKGVSKMKETKTTVKGMVKRGLVLCMVGVMALGMVACGGSKDKKSTSTQPKAKTESNTSAGKNSTTKKQEDEKTDGVKTENNQTDQKDAAAPDQNKTDENLNQGNATTGQQDTKKDNKKGAATSKKKSDKNKKTNGTTKTDKNKKTNGTTKNNSTNSKTN